MNSTQTPPRPVRAAFGAMAAFHAAEMAWVQANDIAALPVGAQVEFSQAGSKERIRGEITANHPEGKSTVCCEHLGHKKTGTGRQGFVVEWEKLTVIPRVQELI